jgi:glucose/arabinose dehydrogenase
VAVWSADQVLVYGTDRALRATLDLGGGRKPVAVRVSPDGGGIAVLDDGGALHLYRTGDGRAVFRVLAGIRGTELAWTPGSVHLVAGGDPVRVFNAADGRELLRLALSPDGAVEHLAVGPDGALAVAHTGEGGQILRRVPWSALAP